MIVLGPSPPCRWIVNFDVDFMDGLVLATLVGAHVPFVVSDFILDLYSNGFCFFQCFQKKTIIRRNISVESTST